jgi:hypothetical protein
MFGTKFSAIAMAAVRIAAAGAVGMAVLAGALLIVGPALLGHGVGPWLISAHPRVQAAPNVCAIAARRYRDDLNYEPPPGCLHTSWFRGNDGHWDRPLPGDWHSQRQPPGAPDAPQPPRDTPPSADLPSPNDP